MEVSFAKPTAAPPTPVVESKPAPATTTTPTSAPATPPPASQLPATTPKPGAVGKADGFLLGDYLPSFKDIILPRLSLAQNIGVLKESFHPGSIVLDRKVALFIPPAMKDGAVTRQATPPVTIIVVGFRPTRFVEKIVGSADRGQIVATEKAVALAGGTLDWSEWKMKEKSGMKLFQPLADAFLVIERPHGHEKDTTNFTYEVDGKFYALALWAMKGTAYTSAAKRVFFTSRRIGILRQGGYPSWSFTVATREDTYSGGNRAWVPICLPKEKTSPAMLEFITQVLSTPSAEATDEEIAEAATAE